MHSFTNLRNIQSESSFAKDCQSIFDFHFNPQPPQPLQSPGYQSPEAQAWNRLVAEDVAHRKSSVSDI